MERSRPSPREEPEADRVHSWEIQGVRAAMDSGPARTAVTGAAARRCGSSRGPLESTESLAGRRCRSFSSGVPRDPKVESLRTDRHELHSSDACLFGMNCPGICQTHIDLKSRCLTSHIYRDVFHSCEEVFGGISCSDSATWAQNHNDG